MVRADALFLHGSSTNVDLVFPDPKSRSELNDFGFGTAWGPRISLMRCLSDVCPNRGYLDGDCHLEVAYFGMDSWANSATITGDILVQFPSVLHPAWPPAAPMGTATFNTSSALYSLEANLRYDTRSWWTLLAGFRWVELSDEFDVAFATGGATSRYNIDVDNHLYGFQVGGEGRLWERNAWRLEGWFKAGIYHNSADQTTFEDLSAMPAGIATVDASGDQTAFLGEIGLNVTYQLTRRLGLRAGYQLMWLDGVALALDQLDNTNPAAGLATLDSGSDLFLHGGHVGLEATW
jgi:hypothetical protein